MARRLDDRPASILVYNNLLAAIHRHEKLHCICVLYTAYVLACCGWNKSKASNTLDVSRTTIQKWVGQYGEEMMLPDL